MRAFRTIGKCPKWAKWILVTHVQQCKLEASKYPQCESCRGMEGVVMDRTTSSFKSKLVIGVFRCLFAFCGSIISYVRTVWTYSDTDQNYGKRLFVKVRLSLSFIFAFYQQKLITCNPCRALCPGKCLLKPAKNYLILKEGWWSPETLFESAVRGKTCDHP